MNPEPLAAWATPGTTVYELHCSTRDYSVKKIVPTAVTRAENGRIVVESGGRYNIIEGSMSDGIFSYLRDDPDNTKRYFLLVGPDDPRANVKEK